MLVVGVTGGSGSGKTCISNALGKIAGNSIDADAVYHELIKNSVAMRKEILERFPQVYDDNGINRKELANIVFNDDQALKDLNKITHKFVVQEIERRIGECYRNNKEIAVVDAPLLFESGSNKLCDVTVGVLASEELRIKRIVNRDRLDEKRALERIKAQPEDDFYRQHCDFIVVTDENTVVDEIAHELYESIMEGMKLPNE